MTEHSEQHDAITDFNASRDKIDFTNIAGINLVGSRRV